MSQIISPPVTGLTLTMNQPPGGRVASLLLAVIAIGQAASATPRYHLKEDSPQVNKKIEKIPEMQQLFLFVQRFVPIFLPFEEERGKEKPFKICNIITMNITYQFVAVIHISYVCVNEIKSMSLSL